MHKIRRKRVIKHTIGVAVMVFSSVAFLFLFLPAVLFAYFICPARFLFIRNLILLFFSLTFYFYGEPKYIAVMLLSIAINYAFGLWVNYERSKGRTGKAAVAISAAGNLLILIYFKYMSFITENINLLFGGDMRFSGIIMPIGISFFTFQGMSYVFDIYYGTAAAQKNILNVALYVSMFPQLIAGPIVRYETVAKEIKERVSSIDKFASGAVRFIYGFAKKIILANAMGSIADTAFATSAERLTPQMAWVGAAAYAFQIYYDFSGYSDMAIGLGKIFGFTFLENFNFPYISKSITEFWRRWHISLGTWFRDYVYIPLGGNRVSFPRHIMNIFVVWLLTGFWHGASWSFVVWGVYFGVILVLEKLFLLDLLKRLGRPFAHFYALLLILLGWVIFRSDNLSYAARYMAEMFNFAALIKSPPGEALYYVAQYRAEWCAAFLFSMPVGRLVAEKFNKNGALGFVRLGYIFSVFGLAVLSLVNSTFNPFIYFRF